jgi:predicted Zn-dependent protease
MCQGRGITRRSVLKYSGVALMPLLGGCDVKLDMVSDQRVVAMGLQAWEEIRAASPVARDPALQGALDRVSARLLAAAGQTLSDWEMLVFDRPEVNAFALPGNKIGVFRGMFHVVANEDQLAAIVGHEIGHLQAEHSQERMNAQVAADWGLNLVSYLLRLGEVEYASEIGAALGIGVEYGLVLPYSRRQELEADRLGLLAMEAAGYAPEQAVDLWRRMDAAAGPRPPEFLATHPAPASRVEAIEEMLREMRAA